jgi:hypothetical protein
LKKAILLLFIIALVHHTAFAQLKKDFHVLGFSLGLSSYNSNVILGANYEYQLPQTGVGLFAVGGLTRLWSFTDKILDNTAEIKYSNIAVGAQLNYNFNHIGPGRFIPFVGIVLGYNNVSTKYTSYNGKDLIGYDQKYKSGVFLWGQGGMRYFFNKKFAGAVRLGLGNFDLSTIEFGLDYRF